MMFHFHRFLEFRERARDRLFLNLSEIEPGNRRIFSDLDSRRQQVPRNRAAIVDDHIPLERIPEAFIRPENLSSSFSRRALRQ